VASGAPDVPFVGRGQELRALAAAYAAADGGEASLVVVGGDAGVGKTRLLAEFTGTLDAVVLRGAACRSGPPGCRSRPSSRCCGAWPRTARHPEPCPPVLARLVPGQPAEAGPSNQAQLFQAFLGLLERLASMGTVVLALEDLHWADRSTRQLLASLAPSSQRPRSA
jgi:AAA ATPase domain